jgi:hypothetical protein
MVFERLLRLQSALPAVLEFAGGVAFLWLLLKGRIRRSRYQASNTASGRRIFCGTLP